MYKKIGYLKIVETIADGIIEMDDDWKKKASRWEKQGKMFRIHHFSWWEQELPMKEKMMNGMRNLDRVGRKVDYIITHSLYSGFIRSVGYGLYKQDRLTDYLENIKNSVKYSRWFCGYYHRNEEVDKKTMILYDKIVRIV